MTVAPALKRLILGVLLLVLGAALFVATAIAIFPARLVEEWVKEAAAARTGLTIDSDPFHRSPPLGIGATRLAIRRGDAELFTIDRLSVRLLPLSLLSGAAAAAVEGYAAGGAIGGTVSLRPGGLAADLAISGLDLHAVGAARAAGIELGGKADGAIDVSIGADGCPSGTVTLDIDGLDVKGLDIAGFALPLSDVESAGLRGFFEEGCRFVVEGLWLEQRDLSARVEGVVTIRRPYVDSPVSLTLELTPRGALVENGGLALLLGLYRKSANFYSIPIGGTIGRPVVGGR
ncbi:MAG TPA: type II secretion system protein GspN [Deltaproteobacteria bacterium]|nr:type II secretion system protein GspN [Deltaproteobacteria bacterium]